MAVRFPALSCGRPLHTGKFLVFISVRGWVNLRATVKQEGLDKLRSPVTSSGIKPVVVFQHTRNKITEYGNGNRFLK
jgi:hypothetical protein